MLAICCRPVTAPDLPFVIRSFLESWAGTEHAIEVRRELGIERPALLDAVRRLLAAVLARGFAVTVACDPEDPDTLYGYVVHRGNVCAWLYVRSTARRLGVATRLMAEAGFVPGRPLTAVFARIATISEARRKGWVVRINPFLALVAGEA